MANYSPPGHYKPQTHIIFPSDSTTPADILRPGYNFDGWYEDNEFATEISTTNYLMPEHDVTVYAKWHVVIGGSIFHVNHWWQNIFDDGYMLHETVEYHGTADVTSEISANVYEGFSPLPFAQQIIHGDGSTIINIYYDRHVHHLTWEFNGGIIGQYIEIPYPAAPVRYTGTTVSPIWRNYNSNYMILGGQIAGIDIGTYTAIFSPKSGYIWSDGTTSSKSVEWNIYVPALPISADEETALEHQALCYGQSLICHPTEPVSPTIFSDLSDKITFTGEVESTELGDHTVYATPKPGYHWVDNTESTRTIVWAINNCTTHVMLDIFVLGAPDPGHNPVFSGAIRVYDGSHYDSTPFSIQYSEGTLYPIVVDAGIHSTYPSSPTYCGTSGVQRPNWVNVVTSPPQGYSTVYSTQSDLVPGYLYMTVDFTKD